MSEAKNSSSGSTSSASSDSKSGSSSTSSSDSSSSSGGAAGKSTRESVGGSKEVHYGYFSSVRNEHYRSGWDEIWGKKTKKSAKRKTNKTSDPVELNFNFDELPDDLRNSLAEHVRKKLRRSQSGFQKLLASGSVNWNLSVRINR